MTGPMLQEIRIGKQRYYSCLILANMENKKIDDPLSKKENSLNCYHIMVNEYYAV